MNEKQPVESLRAKFWDRLQHARPWECDALFEEIVSALPVERVKASRLKSMPRFRNRDELTNQKSSRLTAKTFGTDAPTVGSLFLSGDCESRGC